jgi:uncharacterized protein YjbJ (UPF0337 family)
MYSKTNESMNSLKEIKGNWSETKAKLKQRFALLTENDLLFVNSKEDELLGRLQIKLGKTKDEIRKIINEL